MISVLWYRLVWRCQVWYAGACTCFWSSNFACQWHLLTFQSTSYTIVTHYMLQWDALLVMYPPLRELLVPLSCPTNHLNLDRTNSLKLIDFIAKFEDFFSVRFCYEWCILSVALLFLGMWVTLTQVWQRPWSWPCLDRLDHARVVKSFMRYYIKKINVWQI